MKQTKYDLDNGFSAVELLLTIFIAAIFVSAFYDLYVIIAQSNASAKLDATASDIAYSNLRKYTAKPTYTCDSATDLVANPSATGKIISQTTTNSLPSPLPLPYIQTVRVFDPRGCSSDFPTTIQSVVDYGSPSKRVTHASYVN